jgi:hypothetical protein
MTALGYRRRTGLNRLRNAIGLLAWQVAGGVGGARCNGGGRSRHYGRAHRTSAATIATATFNSRGFAAGGTLIIATAEATAHAAARVSESAATKRYTRQGR